MLYFRLIFGIVTLSEPALAGGKPLLANRYALSDESGYPFGTIPREWVVPG